MHGELADQIRRHAFENYVRPARESGRREVTIRAGDVHDEMGLRARVPAVCDALDTEVFEREYQVRRLRRAGPRHGRTTRFTFAL